MHRALRQLDRGIETVGRAARYLVLPVSLLLFLQWPLRELIGGYAREANDLAQILFALYVSVAVTAATREGSHLAADALSRRYPPAWRGRLARIASLVVLVPTALFILFAGAPTAWNSTAQLERFAETLDPGYFLVRIAALLLALLVLAQAVIDIVSPRASGAS
jgi:TRAP-type C4-dicarboxylate transport system permease small subunit